MLTLVNGPLKGLKIHVPMGSHTRPSSEKLRQGIFNTVQGSFVLKERFSLNSATGADLFCGSGALGFEALALGLQNLFLVDQSAETAQAMQKNLKLVKQALERQQEKREIFFSGHPVEKSYGGLPVLHLLMADPPYHQNEFEKLLELEKKHQKLQKGGLFIFEAHEKEELFTEKTQNALKTLEIKLEVTKNYGGSVVYFFVKE